MRLSKSPALIKTSTAAICLMPLKLAISPSGNSRFKLFTQEEADRFPVDHLDATKLIPEELVPLQVIGRMVLDRWPNNFFAETEQVAYCPSHVVPGIDFSNDPLLQGRLFSYLDTQLSRLASPIFTRSRSTRPSARLPISSATDICRWLNRRVVLPMSLTPCQKIRHAKRQPKAFVAPQ